MSRAALGVLCIAAAAFVPGCAGTLNDLQGTRTATVDLSAAGTAAAVGALGAGGANAMVATPGGVVECTNVFQLRNSSWGNVRVESARVPISTVIVTEPALPATVKPGQSLAVTVVTKLRPGTTASTRTVLLETKGQDSLKLQVQPTGQWPTPTPASTTPAAAAPTPAAPAAPAPAAPTPAPAAPAPK